MRAALAILISLGALAAQDTPRPAASTPPAVSASNDTPTNPPAAAVTQPSDATLAEYRLRSAQLPAEDIAGHYRLARWCHRHGLTVRLHRHARVVLSAMPDHTATRALLGQRQVDGRWTTPTLEERRRAQATSDRIETRVAQLLREIEGPFENRRRAARDALLALADQLENEDLRRGTLAHYATYRSLWRERGAPKEPLAGSASGPRPVLPPGSAGVGLFTINLTKTDLLDLKTVPVSFGNGGSGRLQLPTTRTIGLGTTVAVPLGGGRRD